MYQTIHSNVRQRITLLPRYLADDVSAIIGKIIAIDAKSKGAISLLPQRMSLALPKNKRPSAQIIADLGAAQIFGWAAHTAYDAIFDRQELVCYLPAANNCADILAEYYKKNVFKNFQNCFRRIIQNTHAANAWEQACARDPLNPPDYQQYQILADRGMGHAMGALAALSCAGYYENSPEFTAVENFFRGYIIAKQLHDDACDWTEDLAAGHITPIVSSIISAQPNSDKHREFFSSRGGQWAVAQISAILKEAEQALSNVSAILNVEKLLPLTRSLRVKTTANS
jgi:hypothetical protein